LQLGKTDDTHRPIVFHSMLQTSEIDTAW